MTLQEAKDQVAREQNFKDWADYELYMLSTKTTMRKINLACDMVAELYARSKWDEACKLQREECYHQVVNYHTAESAWKAPIPKFNL